MIPNFGSISNIFMFDLLGESTDATMQFSVSLCLWNSLFGIFKSSVCSRSLEQFFMTKLHVLNFGAQG